MHDIHGDDGQPLSEVVPVMLRDGRRRMLPLAMLFCVIAVTALVVGLGWPKKYFTATTILVSEDNIIQKLMEGVAVTTGVSDRAMIAREVIFSRRVMQEVMEAGGWLANNPTPAERDRISDDIEGRTLIGLPRENLIRIQYWDTDPERAHRVTQHFGDLLMSESREAKLRESREAYEFIAEQVSEYQRKLVGAEQNLKAFREENDEARPGTAIDVTTRISELRRQIEIGRMQLMDLQSRQGSLVYQLGSESESFSVSSRSNQYLERIAGLQDQLDTLRLDYTDEHPDVVRVRHQIADLRKEMESRSSTPSLAVEDAPRVQLNPMHIEFKTQLAATRRDIGGLHSRIRASEELLKQELERSHRVAESETDLNELTRDYEVNRDIYQDLLKRRENARLSMMLDQEGRGLTFRVHEPAAMPTRPSGVRFVHFAIGGLVAAAAMPLGLLFLLVRFDPRVRTAADIERQTGLPVLATVPTYFNETDQQHGSTQIRVAAAVVAITLPGYAPAGLLRWLQGA